MRVKLTKLSTWICYYSEPFSLSFLFGSSVVLLDTQSIPQVQLRTFTEKVRTAYISSTLGKNINSNIVQTVRLLRLFGQHLHYSDEPSHLQS